MVSKNEEASKKPDGGCTITPPNIQTLEVLIRGKTDYVQNKFSAKAREQMRLAQEAGPTGKKNKKRVAKDFMECYRQAMHVSDDGWCGIPAPAFRNGMISACKLAGFVMTRAKLAVFIAADGYDADDRSPLVRITKGEPEYFEAAVRNETNVADIRPRPRWAPGWEAVVRIEYDADCFTDTDVANLMLRVGMQVGIGEGRPDSKKSAGLGWGLFDIVPHPSAVADAA